MFHFKQFVQGPSLNEDSQKFQRANEGKKSRDSSSTITGEYAKKIYEEIISQPSENYDDDDDDVQIIESSPNISNTNKASTSKKEENHVTETIRIVTPKSLNQLMWLCEKDDVEQLRKHLGQVNDINEQDSFGWSLLMAAACAGSENCVRMLLELGADKQLRDKRGLTAADIARKHGKRTISTLIDNYWKDAEDLKRENCRDCNCATSASTAVPVFCADCQQNFSNRNTHMNSISHLLSAGTMESDGSVHYGISEANKGFQMMLRTGWDKSSGLGPKGEGKKFPVKTVLKRDRQGLGNEQDKKQARITHFGPYDLAAIQQERVERESTQHRKEDIKRKNREKRIEIKLRRDFASL